MQKGDDLVMAITAIRDFTRVGVAIPETCTYLAKIQPKFREKWIAISKEAAAGSSLAKELTKHKLWPDWAIAAVTAGEVSGKLAEVLDKVRSFMIDQKAVMGVVKAKVLTPMAYIGMGGLMFVGFMIGVFPGITKSIPDDKRTGLVAVSDFFHNLYQNHLISVVLGIAITLFALYKFVTQPYVTEKLYNAVDSLPGIGDGIRSIYLGFWARFMALLDDAGDISFSEMVLISSALTPKLYHASFKKIVRDAERIGFANAVDDAKFAPGDARKKWPLRINVGLQIAAKTGEIGSTLGTMAPDIVEDGKNQMTKALGGFSALATGLAALGIVAPFVGLMMVQFQMANSLS